MWHAERVSQVICPSISAAGRAYLEAIVADRHRAHEHVAVARTVLHSDDRLTAVEVPRHSRCAVRRFGADSGASLRPERRPWAMTTDSSPSITTTSRRGPGTRPDQILASRNASTRLGTMPLNVRVGAFCSARGDERSGPIGTESPASRKCGAAGCELEIS